jgi:hypothetical protein
MELLRPERIDKNSLQKKVMVVTPKSLYFWGWEGNEIYPKHINHKKAIQPR